MDLNYPTQKIANLGNQLNNIDKIFGSLTMSNPCIELPLKIIPNKLKKKCVKLIQKDQANNLIKFIKQKQISLDDEISEEGHGWTILHHSAKTNSAQCMNYCLRFLYQSSSKSYEQILNKKNCEGDTPLLVACSNKSNDVIRILFEFGGADIFVLNANKLTAYQIALTSCNEIGLQMLMKYQLKIKKRQFINHKALSEQLPQPKSSIFNSIYDCLVDCFTFNAQPSNPSYGHKQTETERKMTKKQQRTSECLQAIPDVEIFWSEVDKVYGRKIPLFCQMSSPFLIKQSSAVVSNLLIVFQVIAEYPQLLKRIIYSTDDRYYVKMLKKDNENLITVDKSFPFFLETNQPVFLSLQEQLWPMVLQKALCQHYNGFFEPGKVVVEELLETITGSDVYCLDLKNRENEECVREKLQKLHIMNRIVLLKSKPECPLKSQDGRIDCFSLLKMDGQNFLVNCPFLLDPNKKKQHTETMEMELHHAHYQSPDCTTVWLEQTQFFQYFQSAVFCNVLGSAFVECNYQKMAISSSQLYLILKTKQRVQNSTIYINFCDEKTNLNISAKKCMGWSMRGSQKQVIQKMNCEVLGQIEIVDNQSPAQMLIFCQLEEGGDEESKKNIVVSCRSVQVISIEVLDNEMGNLQFIECCKKYFNENYRNFSGTIIQNVGNYLLVMAGSKRVCYVNFPSSLTVDNIVEGKLKKEDAKIQMFQFFDIYYAVLSNVSDQVAKDLEIVGFDDNELETSAEEVINNASTQ